MPTGLHPLNDNGSPSPPSCDKQTCLWTLPNVPWNIGGPGMQTGLEQYGLRAIVLVRRQVGNSARLCGSDNGRNPKSETHRSKWYVKSQSVRWVHFNKDRDSLRGFLPSTGSFQHCNITPSSSNKGSQIGTSKMRLLVLFAFAIHFCIQLDSRRFVNLQGGNEKRNASSGLPIWHPAVGQTSLAFLWGVWQPEHLILFFYFMFWVHMPRGLWTIASFLIKLINTHRKFTSI